MLTPDCPDCGRQLAATDVGASVGQCFNCNEGHPLVECEGCGDRVTESQATTESVPGATLWWCPDCAVTNRERGRWA